MTSAPPALLRQLAILGALADATATATRSDEETSNIAQFSPRAISPDSVRGITLLRGGRYLVIRGMGATDPGAAHPCGMFPGHSDH